MSPMMRAIYYNALKCYAYQENWPLTPTSDLEALMEVLTVSLNKDLEMERTQLEKLLLKLVENNS